MNIICLFTFEIPNIKLFEIDIVVISVLSTSYWGLDSFYMK